MPGVESEAYSDEPVTFVGIDFAQQRLEELQAKYVELYAKTQELDPWPSDYPLFLDSGFSVVEVLRSKGYLASREDSSD